MKNIFNSGTNIHLHVILQGNDPHHYSLSLKAAQEAQKGL